MVEISLVQVLHVVFAEYLNLAPKVIIRALDELVLTGILVLLVILAQDSSPALIVALDDLEQAPLVMRNQVFVHNNRVALLIRANDLPEWTHLLVLVEVSPLDYCIAALFKQTLTLVWALHLL